MIKELIKIGNYKYNKTNFANIVWRAYRGKQNNINVEIKELIHNKSLRYFNVMSYFVNFRNSNNNYFLNFVITKKIEDNKQFFNLL